MGCVVGIFTTRRSKIQPFGLDTKLVARMCRLGARQGILVYGFTARDINWPRGTVRGYVFDDGGRWTRRVMPFPDVVYDRLPSRSAERRRAVRRVKQRLLAMLGDRYFNREFFNKWVIHNKLAADPDYGRYLPPTARFRGVGQLRQWVYKYGTVWLKPSDGTQGRGIVVVRRARNGGYVAQRRVDERWILTTTSSLNRVARMVRRMRGGRSYIIQKGLALARYGNRPFDVRLLVQKNAQGEWECTKMVARVAAPGSVTSNISTGGLGGSFQRVAAGSRGVVRARREELEKAMKELGLGMAARIEESLGYRLGELALDLGIDRNGRIWLIEANSKPFRVAQARKSLQPQVRRTLVRPLEYAAHLSRQERGSS